MQLVFVFSCSFVVCFLLVSFPHSHSMAADAAPPWAWLCWSSSFPPSPSAAHRLYLITGVFALILLHKLPKYIWTEFKRHDDVMLNSSQKEGHHFKSPGHWGPFVWRLHGLPLPVLVLPWYSSFLPKFKGENLVSLRHPSEILGTCPVCTSSLLPWYPGYCDRHDTTGTSHLMVFKATEIWNWTWSAHPSQIQAVICILCCFQDIFMRQLWQSVRPLERRRFSIWTHAAHPSISSHRITMTRAKSLTPAPDSPLISPHDSPFRPHAKQHTPSRHR